MGKALFCTLLLLFSVAAFGGCGAEQAQPPLPLEKPAVPHEDVPAEPAPAAGNVPAAREEIPEPAAPQESDAGDTVRSIPARVNMVIDGDTVNVRLEDGKAERVRLIGVDTPESTFEVEPYGKDAAAHAKKRLEGQIVHLELDISERDRHDRLLAYIWLERPDSGSEANVREKMFNAELLLHGYARVMTVPPNVQYAEFFVKFQREAREAGKGLWGVMTADGAEGSRPAAEIQYVGNARSLKLHRPDCIWAQRIAPDNRVNFRTKLAALWAGYEPCRTCRP